MTKVLLGIKVEAMGRYVKLRIIGKRACFDLFPGTYRPYRVGADFDDFHIVQTRCRSGFVNTKRSRGIPEVCE
ncbi:MAG: hypothetical protein PHR37_07950 [Eubacteriales bacterium]|nr:hypothetical protein [Eubacteriales bacterium]